MKNNNVVSLTDAELAALSVPSIKIEVVERDEDGNKYSDMNQDAFWEALQFRAFRACTGKINVDKFKIVIRDICSYLAAHNIPVAQIADNHCELDSVTAFKTAAQILHAYCDESEPCIVTFEGTNCGAYTCIAQLIESIANKTGTAPVDIAEVILKYFKEGDNNVTDSDK